MEQGNKVFEKGQEILLMKLKILRTEEEWNEISEEWNELLEKSISDLPFLRSEYLAVWWQFCGGGEWPNGELYIITGRDQADELVGAAPFFLTENKEGKFQLAHQSSLLLDEVTEMSLPLQAKLLRVLQEHEVDKVGGRAPIPVDVRVIATTNREIRRRIQDQEFREDLYYRLNVVPINLIPLRERKDDIPLLAEYFMKQFCQENSRSPLKMDSATLTLLKKYRWPGNIRELGNIIERTCLMCQGDTLLPSHLFFDEEPLTSGKKGALPTGTIYEMEKDLILQTLEEFNGNKTKAADSLGISIRTLRNKLNEYNTGE